MKLETAADHSVETSPPSESSVRYPFMDTLNKIRNTDGTLPKRVELVSNCCGETGENVMGSVDQTWREAEICPRCHEHCVYEPINEGGKA